MPGLLREYRPSLLVAPEFRGVVSLISREVTHQVWRKDVLPGKRLHVVLGATPLVLSRFLLVRQIRNVESLAIEKQVESNEILITRCVIQFSESLDRPAVVVKVLDRRRIEKTIRR